MLRNASAVHLVDEINIFGSRETSARKPVDFGPERIRKVGRLRPGRLCTAPPILNFSTSTVQRVKTCSQNTFSEKYVSKKTN